MNYKRVTAIGLLLAAAGTLPLVDRASAQSDQPVAQSLEQRVAAIESYLHMSAVEKHESIAADAKSVEDLKAALIKLDREQDALENKLRANDPGKAGSAADRLSGDVAQTRKDLDALRVTLRNFEDRIHKLEQRTR